VKKISVFSFQFLVECEDGRLGCQQGIRSRFAEVFAFTKNWKLKFSENYRSRDIAAA